MANPDGGNTFQTATRVGALNLTTQSSSVDIFESLSPGETQDWFQVKTKGRASKSPFSSLTVSSTGTPLDTSVDIYFRAAGNKQGRGKRVAKFAGGSSDTKKLKVLAGTYFLRVSAAPGATIADNRFYLSMFSFNAGNSLKSAANAPSSTTGRELFF
jgi:hypothetical protein